MFSHKFSIGVLALGCVVATSCGSDDTTTAASTATTAVAAVTTTPLTTEPATTEPATTVTTIAPTTTSASDAMYPNGLRNVRYCEVVLITKPAESFNASVWNTMGLSECPQADFDALDTAAIAADNSALIALRNGPRYWVLDRIESDIRDTAPVTRFGNLDMFRGATIDFGEALPVSSPYAVRQIERDTVFTFWAGTSVFELTDPDGKVYVMQSYSLMIDPTLTIDGLTSLGATLQLPAGWTFSTRVLDADLNIVDVDGFAPVVQDELQNTYQFEFTGP